MRAGIGSIRAVSPTTAASMVGHDYGCSADSNALGAVDTRISCFFSYRIRYLPAASPPQLSLSLPQTTCHLDEIPLARPTMFAFLFKHKCAAARLLAEP